MLDEIIEINNIEIQVNIKILLYKENEKIFDLLDFEDENIYKEPLLFTYLNNKEGTITYK